MIEYFRCQTGDTRCPNAARRWFVVADLTCWNCPIRRSDCKMKLGRVPWRRRHPRAALLLKASPFVFAALLLSVWWWCSHALTQAKETARVARVLSEDVERSFGQTSADLDRQLTAAEQKAAALGPQAGLVLQVQTLREILHGLGSALNQEPSRVPAFRQKLQGIEATLGAVQARADRWGIGKTEMAEAQQFLQVARQRLDQGLTSGETRVRQNLQERWQALGDLVPHLTEAADVWQAGVQMSAANGKTEGMSVATVEDATTSLRQIGETVTGAVGAPHEIDVLDRATEQMAALTLPEVGIVPVAPATTMDALRSRLQVEQGRVPVKPENREAAILADASAKIDVVQSRAQTLIKAGGLAASKQQVSTAINQRRENLTKEWQACERLLVVAATKGLPSSLVQPLVEAYLRQTVRAESRVVKRDATGVWLGYQEGNNKRVVEVRANTEEAGYTALLNGSDLVVIARSPKPVETNQLAALGDLRSPECAQVIALDAVAVLSAPSKPMVSIEADAVPKSERLIPTSSSGEGYLLPAMQDFGLLVGPVVPTTALVVDAVQSAKGLIGLGSYSAYSRSGGRSGLASLSAEADAPALAPSPFTIANEDYKFSVRLLAVHAAKARNDAVRDFVRFVTSPAGQSVVGANGFVDLSPRLGDDKPYPPPFPIDARRLSPSLRFEFAKSQLDLRALADLERLVRRLGEPDMQQKVVCLAGHADGVGDDPTNDRLSLERARQVEGEMKRRGVRQLVSYGFGKRYPVDTNDNDAGRQKNRRVEVWVSAGASKPLMR